MKKDKEAKKKKKEKSVQVSVPETVKTVSPETEDAILETLLQHIGGNGKFVSFGLYRMPKVNVTVL